MTTELLATVTLSRARDPLLGVVALATLLTKPRAEQVATLRAWVAEYRTARQAVRDGIAQAAIDQQTALDAELAAIDANTP